MPSRLSHLSREELEQLVLDQARVIAALEARIAELEKVLAAKGGRPPRTSKNSSCPPSRDHKSNRPAGQGRKQRSSRSGSARRLAEHPDRFVQQRASSCQHCGGDVSGQRQACRHRYDRVDLPLLACETVRVELFGGRCGHCGRRFKARAPDGMPTGTPFGPNIHALLLYLHYSHHVGFERLSRFLAELFGVTISEGAIANAFGRMARPLDELRCRIKAKLKDAPVIASDETTTRIDGVTNWQWTFVTDCAVLHEIAPRRARSVAEDVLGDHRPEVWVSDRYAGQQELAACHQVCLAHVLRDVQYAIDRGDEGFAPKLRKLLRWAIRVGRRRDELKDITLAQYHAKAERQLDALLAIPPACTAARELQAQVKAWRGKYFVFLTDRRVPATNNICEREIRPSVVFRKVTGGFRSDWGAQVHAGYRSLTSTAKTAGQTAWQTMTDLTGRVLIQPEEPLSLPTR
ncbi:MAG: IS66 family transposase [Geminicoccaceae bacterium]